MKRLFWLIVLFVFVIAAALPIFAAHKLPPTGPPPPSILSQNSAKLNSLNKSKLLLQMNKQVELEGYFYDGSVPMIVEDLNLVGSDSPLPPDKYVPIAGPLTSEFKSGAKVKLGGKIKPPAAGSDSQGNLVLDVSEVRKAEVLKQSSLPSLTMQLDPGVIVQPGLMTFGKKYALLIGGGKNPDNNHVRYWNDIRVMYSLLISNGFLAENIRVAYSNKVPKGTGMPIHYAATMYDINSAFNYFAPKVKAEDTFYLMFSGQGNIPGEPPVYWTWGGIGMSPGMLVAQTNKITQYKKMIIQMNQSCSGTFINYLRRPKRIIITSAAANTSAYAHPSLMFGNFFSYYASALRSHSLFTGMSIDADTNNNGEVSIAEAYNYTLGKGSPVAPINIQKPQYEDNAAPPSRFGPIPGGGEGVLGLNTNL